MIRCAVYFHFADEKEAVQYKDLEYVDTDQGRFMAAFGMNTTDNRIQSFLTQPRRKIKDDEYDHLMRFIAPSEEARLIRHFNYSPRQLRLIESAPKHQKIKGVAGSGKSLVLAARAVNALKRTNGRILIVTFNITLINYLHDRISQVRGMLHRRDFDVISYHAFINSECNNYGVPTEDKGDFNSFDSHYNDINLFETCKESIVKYDAIFIDEVQDFEYEWQQILSKYFLIENGEFVLFGDEKQNIYNRELEDKKIRTIIPGAWNQLDESYRLAEKTTELANAFQAYFFTNRYELDSLKFQVDQLEFDLLNKRAGEIHYVHNELAINALPFVRNFFEQKKIHPNDIVFLGINKIAMRDFEHAIKQNGERTTTMFTSKEEDAQLSDNPLARSITNEIERARKVGFWMNSGCIKLSTIQSFKGWEANTVILVISKNSESQEESIDELIYTGLTRCKQNLIIINESNSRMHQFFTKERNLFHSFQ